MVFPFAPTAGPDNPDGNAGVHLTTLETTVYNRTGGTLSKGQVSVLDLTGTQSESDSAVFGEDGSVYGNVRSVAAADVSHTRPAIFCVALEEIADNAVGKVCYFGKCQALVERGAGSATVSFGSNLVAVASTGILDATTASGEIIVARYEDADATIDTNEVLKDVFLYGPQLFGATV